jgi:hypothetical protein
VSAARISLATSSFAGSRSDKLSYADLRNGPPGWYRANVSAFSEPR